MSLPSLSIVIVNYNTRELTLACLRSIYRFPPEGDFEVIVVDNASRDGSVEAIAEQFSQVDLIASEENLGFARGNNVAMARSKGDILFLLNSDTEVHEGALTNLQRFLEEQPSAAVVGGMHHKTDGSLQTSIKYFPRLRNMFSEAFFLHRLFSGPAWSEHETRLPYYHRRQRAEWLAGSYLAVRREWYERVGGLDPGFFMYSEDTDWCYRIHRAGGELWYIPESVITHHGGGSSGGINSLSITLCLSRDRYARLHFSPLKALCYRCILTAGLVLRGTLFTFLAPFTRGAGSAAGQRWTAALALWSRPIPIHPPSQERTTSHQNGVGAVP
jgi:GT2 family glycosyltransferase